jgi:hypothetical protein
MEKTPNLVTMIPPTRGPSAGETIPGTWEFSHKSTDLSSAPDPDSEKLSFRGLRPMSAVDKLWWAIPPQGEPTCETVNSIGNARFGS